MRSYAETGAGWTTKGAFVPTCSLTPRAEIRTATQLDAVGDADGLARSVPTCRPEQ